MGLQHMARAGPTRPKIEPTLKNENPFFRAYPVHQDELAFKPLRVANRESMGSKAHSGWLAERLIILKE
jgi:hypothetical protein